MAASGSYANPTRLTNKRVFVTGTTGFTGGWLCCRLLTLGAEIKGYSLTPDTTPDLFTALGLAREFETVFADIRDLDLLQRKMHDYRPDIVIHLAAQALVRRGYREPVPTFDINSRGTMHVLEAARTTDTVAGVVCVTTDKVYEDPDTPHAYVETDRLGGSDPYSASKAAAEMVVSAYRNLPQSPIIAVARGGNVIGGGDWSEDRLIPDFVRAITSDATLVLRNPQATRPWQHVLDLVDGYLRLASGIACGPREKADRAYNFGPVGEDSITVQDLVEAFGRCWRKPAVNVEPTNAKESQALALDSSAALAELNWRPRWRTLESLQHTADWYREYSSDPASARALTDSQCRLWDQSQT